jgi:glycerol-3-phosphate dehydrogenase
VPDALGTPVYGGDIPHFTEFMEEARARYRNQLSPEVIHALARNHGTRFKAVLDVGEQAGLGWHPIPGTRTLPAEIVYVAREEMACTLSDVVFTRTDMAAAEDPGRDALGTAADLVAAELGWSAERRAAELDEVGRRLAHRR